jgi:hypothetical protein
MAALLDDGDHVSSHAAGETEGRKLERGGACGAVTVDDNRVGSARGAEPEVVRPD